MLKQIFFLILALFIFVMANAQENTKYYFGFTGSTTFIQGKTTRQTDSFTHVVQIKPAPGLRYGISYGFYLKDNLSFSSAVLFGLQAEYFKFVTDDPVTFFDFFVNDLEIPILLKYSFNGSKIMPAVSGGFDFRAYKTMYSELGLNNYQYYEVSDIEAYNE